ncbi:glycosyltransferase family 2 protein [Thermomonas carbonis]|uniref:Glycosyltransferase family 2 protein n=1 Tax=Thermomonas carbonis TaxID=1463158 RepID=A0A7G9SQ68_9GAMM|nr:glycosyltransferase family 2 protein [Thermomonas carbonis]QNN69993.1 glycosyltransferase family 2 protein [Thermomonas carbonis]
MQQLVPGDDHRLLVLHGQLVAATRRNPPTIVGDGRASVAQLVARLNANRLADPMTARYLQQVKRELLIDRYLAAQGLDWNAIPTVDRRVALRGNANVSTGGGATDVLQQVHPHIRRMAEAIAANLGMASIGIDYLCSDISLSPEVAGGAIIEVNTTPGLDLHLADHGYSEEALGALVLGDGLGAIATVVVVDDDASSLRALATADFQVPGLGIVGNEWATLDGLQLTLAESGLHDRTARMLAQRSCNALLVLATVESIAREGFPVPASTLTLWCSENQGQGTLPAWGAARRCSMELQEVAAPSADAGLQSIARALTVAPMLPRAPSLRRDAQLRTLRRHRDTGGPAVFAIMRNESCLLPHFLDHYRALGVEDFHILDDNSSDGTREFLLEQPDCTVWATPAGFSEMLANGEKLLHHVRNAIPATLGTDRWVVGVDADEFLLLPSRFDGLLGAHGLLAHLDRQGWPCMLAEMVELYPRRLCDAFHVPLDAPPLQAPLWFDQDPTFERRDDGRPKKRAAGIRWRLQQMLLERHPTRHRAIYEGQNYALPALWKTPLAKTGNGVVYLNAHSCNRTPPSSMQLALAHLKYGPDLRPRVRDSLATKSHFMGSIEYRLLDAALELLADEDLLCEKSRVYEGGASLERAGMMFVKN